MDSIKPTTQHKPKPDFEIWLIGQGLKPWAVPMCVLVRVLTALQRLIEPTEEIQGELESIKATLTPSISPLHLIGIVSHSAGYGISTEAPERTIKTAKGSSKRKYPAQKAGGGFVAG